MKFNLKALLVILIVPMALTCQDHKSTDKPSTHGMLLMGTQTVYASHLPMFHSPHDYQIIISLGLNEKEKAKYIEDRTMYKDESVYTLEPEVFVLPEKVHAKGSFKATIYRGHFERGGAKILEDIEVRITDIIYFKKFETKTPRPENKEYIFFGNADEQFLAHRITTKPDFDEILQITTSQKDVKLLDTTKFVTVEFPEKETREPFTWNGEKAKIKHSKQQISMDKLDQLYLEFGDLE